MKTILYLHGAGGPPPADAPFRVVLGQQHRLVVPALVGDAAAGLAAQLAGGAHVVAEGAAAPIACRLALDHAALVESLVLSAPAAADEALVARLGDIAAPCLLLQASQASAADQAAIAAYQQSLPRATRILFYGANLEPTPAWTRLVADFIDRGEQFVVNIGEEA